MFGYQQVLGNWIARFGSYRNLNKNKTFFKYKLRKYFNIPIFWAYVYIPNINQLNLISSTKDENYLILIPLVTLSLAKEITSISHLILFQITLSLVWSPSNFVNRSFAIATSLFENASRCKWLAVWASSSSKQLSLQYFFTKLFW